MASRRSGRQRRNTKKYTEDASDEHEDLQGILDTPENRESPQNEDPQQDRDSSQNSPEDGFLSDAPAAEHKTIASQDDESDDSTSNSSRENDDLPEDPAIQSQVDASDAKSGELNDEAHPGSETTKETLTAQDHGASGSDYDSDLDKHARAAIKPPSRPSRLPGHMLMLGDDPSEAQAIIKAKSLFFDQVTLPRRLIPRDYKGIPPPNWAVIRHGETDKLATQIAKLQKLSLLDEQHSSVYATCRSSRDVLAGSPATYTVKHLPPHSAIRMHDFVVHEPQDSAARPAWLLNVGQPVQSLAWAPTQIHTSHFLAVSSLSPRLPEPFTPCGDSPGSIDVWEFKAAEQPQANMSATFNMETPPKRRLVLCGDFGSILRMAWSPHKSCTLEEGISDLGLLAAVSADGHLRVLSVTCSTESTDEPVFVKIEATAIDIAPADTLITCLVWLSETTLAAGCANGHIGVWDLEECLQTKSMRPQIWHGVSRTYILTIDACLPSRPGILVTSSMDGHVRWTSLSHLTMDCIQSPRSRVGSCFALWHDTSQNLLYPEDLYNLRSINLRRAWSTSYVCTLPAPAQAAAVSSQHSSTLIGCSDGTVQVVNPLRRVFARSFRNADYTQTWFTHDWRKGRKVAADTDELDYTNGLSRLTSGYSVEIAEEPQGKGIFQKNRHGPKSQRESRVTGNGVLFATVHEYATEIRALSWNPHASAQGWAAAGMEDGLLLVEDLCWD